MSTKYGPSVGILYNYLHPEEMTERQKQFAQLRPPAVAKLRRKLRPILVKIPEDKQIPPEMVERINRANELIARLAPTEEIPANRNERRRKLNKSVK